MKNRVLFKVVSTILNFFMSIMIGIIVPHVIGPEDYGTFNYIISTYSFLFQIFMFTSSTAYIYFLSSNKYKVEDINTFYIFFLLIISLIVTIVSIFSINSSFGIKYLWNNLDNYYLLYLGLIFAIFTNMQQRLIEFSDSTSQTIVSEKLKLVSKFIMVLTIGVFVYMDSFNIYWYFILFIVNMILFFVLFFKYITFKVVKIDMNVLKIFNNFYMYLKPLILFSLIAAIYSYLGKYVLQASGGSIEQGYYNFAYQLVFIPVIFISSIMTIYMSEMTKKFEKNDIIGVKKLFINNVFKIYAIHAFIAFFIMINAKDIIVCIVGNKFLGAVEALKFLSIFSLLHTFGMLSGNLFFSSGRNKEYTIINSMIMVMGIITLLYILFFSKINASSLAFIMMLFYMLRVIIQLYMNLDYLKIKKTEFILEFLIVSIVIYSIVYFIYYFNLTLLVNLLLVSILLICINFVFNDYIKIKFLRR